MSVTALVGAQLGSEGKGVFAAYLANEYDIHIRVGGPNAGHSFKVDGETHVVQSVPCGWINKDASLMIGAGGMIHLPTLFKELDEIRAIDPTIDDRFFIDPHAIILTKEMFDGEGGIHGEIHQRIGSTGEGVGLARVARIERQEKTTKLAKHEPLLAQWVSPSPLSRKIYNAMGNGAKVFLEGTQGSGLSLIHGPWPYVTSADTNTAQLLADAGIAPNALTETIIVARTFPIRVAGNSGPLKDEITWEDISKRLGRPTSERTTVTKKTRRIGKWDDELFLSAVRLNGPTQVAISFMDYLSPGDEGKTEYDLLYDESKEFVQKVEKLANAPVTFIGTGGPNWAVIDRR